MKNLIKGVFLVALLGWVHSAQAGCSVHDHNCLHGVYPLDPALGNVPTGPATLEVITSYGNAPDVDLNQHVGLPANQGPFVASGSDGNPVEATPLGGGAEVIFHDQQTVQYANGSAGGTLTSTPGTEQTVMIGNVAKGTYDVAVYNYDENELGLTGTYSTTATAGGTGHFDAPSQSHVATATVQSITVLDGALAPDQDDSSSFEYYNNGFSPHAQGVYLIPGGTWNIGGVSIAQSNSSPFQFEYMDTSLSQDQVAIDFLSHIQPESTEVNLEFGGWITQNENGGYGATLSVGDANSVSILHPDIAVDNGAEAVGMFHTHQSESDIEFSNADVTLAELFGTDSYIINGDGDVGKLSVKSVDSSSIEVTTVTLERSGVPPWLKYSLESLNDLISGDGSGGDLQGNNYDDPNWDPNSFSVSSNLIISRTSLETQNEMASGSSNIDYIGQHDPVTIHRGLPIDINGQLIASTPPPSTSTDSNTQPSSSTSTYPNTPPPSLQPPTSTPTYPNTPPPTTTSTPTYPNTPPPSLQPPTSTPTYPNTPPPGLQPPTTSTSTSPNTTNPNA